MAASNGGYPTWDEPGESSGFELPFIADPADDLYFDISPLLNTNDHLAMQYLIQSCIADSKGYKILSFQELNDLKKERTVLRSRLSDLHHKLTLESKLRDAASSLSKLHLQTSPTLSSTTTSSNNSGRKSFLFHSGPSKEKKRLSKHAEEELDVSSRRIQSITGDLLKLTERLREIESRIHQHHIGILALTHPSYGFHFNKHSSGGGSDFSSHPGSPPLNHHYQPPAIQATSRMIRPRVSNSHLEQHYHGEYSSSESSEIDSLISLVSDSLSTATTSPRPPPEPSFKISHLSDLTHSLVTQYSATRQQITVKDSTIEELKGTISQVLTHYGRKEPSSSEWADPRAINVLVAKAIRPDKEKDLITTTANTSITNGPVKLLQDELMNLRTTYESNRAELDKLELENVDLKANLLDITFKSKAETQQLQNELSANTERVQEWKERCETFRTELENVLKSLEDLTRQTVENESERVKLENNIRDLQQKLFEESSNSLDRKVNSIEADPNEPLSVGILRNEFKKIILDLNSKYFRELNKEQNERKKLEALLRTKYRSEKTAGEGAEQLKGNVGNISEDHKFSTQLPKPKFEHEFSSEFPKEFKEVNNNTEIIA